MYIVDLFDVIFLLEAYAYGHIPVTEAIPIV